MNCIASLLVVLILASFAIAQIASGGQFTLTQSVIANGGRPMENGQFKLAGTAGQSVTGQKASIQPLAEVAGFWFPDDLLPTAAHVSLSGSITSVGGGGIPGVRVTMMGPSNALRYATSNSFGNFRFDDVEVGATYIFSVASRRYLFRSTVIVRNVLDSLDDLNFVALEN